MKSRITGSLILCALAGLYMGCSQNQEMSPGDMKPPPRPAELDRLSMFLGSWQGESEMHTAGSDKPVKMTGTNRCEWACEQRFLMEHFTGKMGEGPTFTGLGMWTWDTEDKKYRSWWFDSFGNVGTGEGTYDAATRTWTMAWQGMNPATGKPTYGTGTFKLPDDKTMEYDWKEWTNSLKWGKPAMWSKGVSKKS